HGFAPQRRVLGDRQLLLATRSAWLGIMHGRYVPGHDDVSVRETWIRPARRVFGDQRESSLDQITPRWGSLGVTGGSSGFLGVPVRALGAADTSPVNRNPVEP